MLGLFCFAGFFLVVASRGYSLVTVHRLLIVVVSLVAEHALGHTASIVVAHGLSGRDTRALEYGLNCSKACGIFPNRGSNPHLLHCPVDSLPLSHRGHFRLCF